MNLQISPPNYTQTPNDLFDKWLPLLKESELKVLLVIMRKTFGWHKTKDIISVTQLEKYTGLSRETVIIATKSLHQNGLIHKQVIGPNGSQQTIYELAVAEESNNSYQSDLHPPGGITPPVGFTPLGKSDPQKKDTTKETDDDDTCARNKKNICKDDIHLFCLKAKMDWLSDEIDKAWDAYLKFQGNVEHPFEYIEAIIMKNRTIKQSKENKEKPCLKKKETTETLQEKRANSVKKFSDLGIKINTSET